MRVVWSLDDGTRHQQQVYLVRADHGDLDVAAVLQTVRGLFPDVVTRMEHHEKDMLEGLVLVQADALRTQLLALRMRPEVFLMGDQGRFALAFKVLRHLAALGNAPGNTDPVEWAAYVEGEYQARVSGLTSGPDGEETQQPEPVEDSVPGDIPYRRHSGSL